MKKGSVVFSLCAAVVLLLFVGPLFGQDSGLFVKTVPVVKVYANSFGYKIVYVKTDMTIGEIYVPLEWFTTSGSKGNLIWGEGPEYPYFSIFYLDGKFSHIRLYVDKNVGSSSWGTLSNDTETLKKFDIQEINPEF